MRWFIPKALLFVIVVMAFGCTKQSSTLFPPQVGEQTRTIFLISHGLHAGIVLRRSDIRQPGWPQLQPFDDMEYLEIGWGDKDYYISSDPGAGLAVKALLMPTASVLHLVGFNGSPESYFPNSEIIKIELSIAGFEKMVRYLSKSFLRDEYGSAVPLDPGKYGHSRFYASEETYYLCKTCNTWTATILKTAGCPVTSNSCSTASATDSWPRPPSTTIISPHM